MKKLFYPAVKVMTFASIILLTNCSKDKGVGPGACSDNSKKVSEAATAWSSDITNKTKCEAYKTAIRDFYKSCPTFYTGASKQALDEFLNYSCD